MSSLAGQSTHPAHSPSLFESSTCGRPLHTHISPAARASRPTDAFSRGFLSLHSPIRPRFERGQITAVNQPKAVDLCTFQGAATEGLQDRLPRDSAYLRGLTHADIIFRKIAHGC